MARQPNTVDIENPAEQLGEGRDSKKHTLNSIVYFFFLNSKSQLSFNLIFFWNLNLI